MMNYRNVARQHKVAVRALVGVHCPLSTWGQYPRIPRVKQKSNTKWMRGGTELSLDERGGTELSLAILSTFSPFVHRSVSLGL